ncbi:hypothetical protein [Emticicia soli]|uniref:Uncharacterized protein n=1 Tax=Emticicia soli TaxID=2027878 RepID=A0ABW5J850_9BACT
MNNILAQYLFNKEVIYKNPQVEVAPAKETIAEVKKEAKEATPVVKPTPVLETPKVEPPKPVIPATPVVPVAVPLKLTQKVVVITELISNDEKTLLSKILGAVGLSLAQIDLIEIEKPQHIDYQAFVAQKTTNKFISFGVGLGKLNWDLMLVPYQIKTESGIDFLLANNLGAIATDTTLKKNLWAALQQMFSK